MIPFTYTRDPREPYGIDTPHFLRGWGDPEGLLYWQGMAVKGMDYERPAPAHTKPKKEPAVRIHDRRRAAIREAMKAAGLNCNAVAAMIGCRRSTVEGWITTTQAASKRHIQAFCEALGLDAETLVKKGSQ